MPLASGQINQALRWTRVRGLLSKILLWTFDAYKIRHGCNILQFPCKLHLWESEELSHPSRIKIVVASVRTTFSGLVSGLSVSPLHNYTLMLNQPAYKTQSGSTQKILRTTEALCTSQNAVRLIISLENR